MNILSAFSQFLRRATIAHSWEYQFDATHEHRNCSTCGCIETAEIDPWGRVWTTVVPGDIQRHHHAVAPSRKHPVHLLPVAQD